MQPIHPPRGDHGDGPRSDFRMVAAAPHRHCSGGPPPGAIGQPSVQPGRRCSCGNPRAMQACSVNVSSDQKRSSPGEYCRGLPKAGLRSSTAHGPIVDDGPRLAPRSWRDQFRVRPDPSPSTADVEPGGPLRVGSLAIGGAGRGRRCSPARRGGPSAPSPGPSPVHNPAGAAGAGEPIPPSSAASAAPLPEAGEDADAEALRRLPPRRAAPIRCLPP